MAPATCLRLVGQVAAALDAAHRLGVVHAGLTPANVLIDAAGDAHVTDFWIPWVLERLGAFPGDGGKARRDAYRAPEQVAEGRAGPEADQYALAAVMRACLSGKPLREEGNGMPPRVARALERALSPAPADRFASVAEFVAALEPGAPAEHGADAAPLGVLYDDVEELDDEPAPPAPRRRWVRMSVLGLVVVGGAVATAWLLGSGATMNVWCSRPRLSRLRPSAQRWCASGVTRRSGPRRGRGCLRGPRRSRVRPAASSSTPTRGVRSMWTAC